MDKPETAIPVPGEIVTIDGERWEVGAWHTDSGEPMVFLTLLGNHGCVALWPRDQLLKVLRRV